MNKLLAGAFAAVVALVGTVSVADIVGPNPMSQTLSVTTLATSCSFSVPVTGTMPYDEPNAQFTSVGGTAATMNITYRELTTLNIVNDGVFDGKSDAITDIDYTGTTFDGNAFTNGATGSLAASVTLTSSGALQIGELSLLPTSMDVALAQIDDYGNYPTSFTVTCVE